MLRTDDERWIFLISGVMSLLLFVFLFSLFFQMLFHERKLQTYGLRKKEYISISLESLPVHSSQSLVKSVKQPKKKKIVQKKRDKVDAINENVDVNSLFSNIWTKKVDTHAKPKRKVDAKRIAEIEKSIATSEFFKKSEIDGIRQKSKNTKVSSSAEEVNKYSAKIHAIVYENFFPPENSVGEQVKAVIELSPLGKMLDFHILNYSGSEALNKEADKIKDRIKNTVFPKNPTNEIARIVIILKPEAKE